MMNRDIRDKIKNAGLYQYQIAEEVGVNEVTLIRWLRKPLESKKKLLVNQAIKKLGKKGVDKNGR